MVESGSARCWRDGRLGHPGRCRWALLFWPFRPEGGLCGVKSLDFGLGRAWDGSGPRAGRVLTRWAEGSWSGTRGVILFVSQDFRAASECSGQPSDWVQDSEQNGTVFGVGSSIQFHLIPFTPTYLERANHRRWNPPIYTSVLMLEIFVFAPLCAIFRHLRRSFLAETVAPHVECESRDRTWCVHFPAIAKPRGLGQP